MHRSNIVGHQSRASIYAYKVKLMYSSGKNCFLPSNMITIVSGLVLGIVFILYLRRQRKLHEKEQQHIYDMVEKIIGKANIFSDTPFI